MKTSGQWQLKEGDIRRVVNLYKCGDPLKTSDLVTLFSDFIDKKLKKRLKEIDDYLSRELVYKRNIKMANKIDEMLKDGRNDEARMFFAVGAGNTSLKYFIYVNLTQQYKENQYLLSHFQLNSFLVSRKVNLNF